ncbi:MAG: tRNA (adenosine(37)-N6)-threonylcarbamoyltransferase complex dimerization subunit type 1 TsaB [Victivallales bacterium]|nr:tRNA (adenosine(37)-N6)-threonylcarbamoyltransferase complex dimerization subunit type 1 TsaB [Victivallales bacterium]
MAFHASLDTSIGFSLAVLDGNQVVLQATMPGMGRESDRLLTPWLMAQLATKGISLQEITHWTLGTGPGSFAGLRCGIAMVKGIVAVTGAVMRGVPSAYALAVQAATPAAQSVGVLHDGRCGQVLLAKFSRNADGFRLADDPTPLNPQELLAEANHCDCYATAQADSLPELPPEVASCLKALPEIDASELARAPEALYSWPTDLAGMEQSTTPLYVRPAVFVKPAELKRLEVRG